MIGIPKNAKRVFKGIIFDVYQWEQELFDGTKATFEKLKRPNSACVIAMTEDKKLLLCFDEQPSRDSLYALPGGRVDDGEDAMDAAKRELLEETGHESQEWELFRSDVPCSKMDWTVYTYIARNCKKVRDPHLDAGEKIEVQELSFDEYVNTVAREGFQDQELSNVFLRMMKEGTLNDFKDRLLK